MPSPVHFATIEQELEPLSSYIQGRVLNAGCGNRDISGRLMAWGAVGVDNCDIETTVPGAFTCDLEHVPRSDNTYDVILCNAVLEHVPNVHNVMREFKRLLVPGGHLLLSIPFLQPYHAAPRDYRRLTRHGLVQLGEETGFTTLEVKPVHSLAQTVGWILWTDVHERGSKLGKAVLWLPIFVITRLFWRPGKQFNTANALQAVMVKTHT